MSDRVRLYLDADDKWRWRWFRGHEVIDDSVQGYVHKRDCLNSLMAAHGEREYVMTYESRRNATRRAYQQGYLRRQGAPRIPVEVTPWTLEKWAAGSTD